MKTSIQTLPPYKNEFLLRQKYCQEKLSTRQISEQFFSARSTIVANLKAFGIPLRSEDEAHKLNKGQLRYGERRINGELINHKRELENLQRMAELRDQGLSYHKIADVFNTMKIPTKNRGKRWHATTVMKMLKASESLSSKEFRTGAD